MDNFQPLNSWEQIHGFSTPGEYKRFVDYIERQIQSNLAVEVPCDPNYNEGMLVGGRWFQSLDTLEVWRLIPPDFPFRGLWAPIRY